MVKGKLVKTLKILNIKYQSIMKVVVEKIELL